MALHINTKAFLTSFVGTIVGFGFYMREKAAGKKYTYETDAVKGKLVVITGATSGIGLATAKELAIRKAKVIMACRDRAECEKEALKIRYASHNKAVVCYDLDLASQESIRNFVDKINEKHSKLDILINNAAVLGPPRELTKDGIELQLGVNHMGPFLLTNLLLPNLKNAAPSRIINLTSTVDVEKGVIKKDDLNSSKNYEPMEEYKQSKLANILFTKELAERLKGTGITVNAVYPGVVNTKLMRHQSYYKSYISTIFLKPFMFFLIKNSTHGAQTVVYAAAEPDIKDITGTLFGHNFVHENLPLPENIDNDLQKWMWDVSAKWTKLYTYTSSPHVAAEIKKEN